jgi:hypothetical protein
MTAQAALVPTVYIVEPNLGCSIYQISYTKAAQSDTIDVASYTPIKTILMVLATDNTAGAFDAVTWSGTEITLTSADTSTGSMIVIGKC